jgi:hypothetical protein
MAEDFSEFSSEFVSATVVSIARVRFYEFFERRWVLAEDAEPIEEMNVNTETHRRFEQGIVSLPANDK